MIVILLCAGFATRMRPLTRNFPKPLLKVGGKPVLDYLMEQIAPLPGLQTVHLVSNSRYYDHFMAWSLNWRAALKERGLEIILHDDGARDNASRLGALGDMLFVRGRLGRDPKAMIAAGDNVFRFSLAPMWERFRAAKRESFVVGVHETDKAKLRRTGVLSLDDDSRVLDMAEKPDEPCSSWGCPPLYFYQPWVWPLLEDYLKDNPDSDSPGSFVGSLCSCTPLFALKTRGARLDIGNMETYCQADELLSCEPVMQDRASTRNPA